MADKKGEKQRTREGGRSDLCFSGIKKPDRRKDNKV